MADVGSKFSGRELLEYFVEELQAREVWVYFVLGVRNEEYPPDAGAVRPLRLVLVHFKTCLVYSPRTNGTAVGPGTVNKFSQNRPPRTPYLSSLHANSHLSLVGLGWRSREGIVETGSSAAV